MINFELFTSGVLVGMAVSGIISRYLGECPWLSVFGFLVSAVPIFTLWLSHY